MTSFDRYILNAFHQGHDTYGIACVLAPYGVNPRDYEAVVANALARAREAARQERAA